MKSEDVVGKNVFTCDGKKIGKVYSIEQEHLLARKRGLLTEEQFRIPTNKIVSNSENVHNSITINLTEDQLKHGYVFSDRKPNSGLVHGLTDLEPKLKLRKQVKQFSPMVSADADNSLTVGLRPVPAIQPKINTESAYYSCDICPCRFSSPDQLQKHRADIHKAATNI